MPSEPSRKRRTSQPVRALLLFSQPTVLALAIAAILMQWQVATVVQVDMIAAFPESGFDEIMLRARIASGEFFPAQVRQILIRYPEYPEIREKSSAVDGKFMLVPIERLTINGITSDAVCQEIRIVLEGLVKQAYLTRENQSHADYRLTLFETLTRSSLALGSGIMIWLFLTALGWIKVYRELKRYM